jgi:hypothetical protein
MSASVRHVDELERIRIGGAGWWRPIRSALGVTGVAVNAYTADQAGDELIEHHDETGHGAAGHEELYVVLTGRATFTVGGEERDAPAGTLVLVGAETRRGAVAAEPDTTVLVLGGAPGAALPVSAYEYWYRAEPAYRAGDYETAAAIAGEGLAEWPRHPSLRYQLACYEALAGHREAALEHLRIAYAEGPRTREWAAGDEDLASVRDDPSLA